MISKYILELEHDKPIQVDDLKTIQTGLELAKPMNNEIKSRLYLQKDNEEVVGGFDYASDLKWVIITGVIILIAIRLQQYQG